MDFDPPAHATAMSLRLILLLVSLGLVWRGGKGVLSAAAERRPTVATCAEFIAGRVSARWVELRGCDVALSNALHFAPEDGDSTAHVSRIYIPIGNPADGGAPDSHVYLATRDRELVEIYNGFSDNLFTPLSEMEAFRAKHLARFREVRNVRGVARRGVELMTHERDIQVNGRTWDDIVIVDEAAGPEPVISLIMLGGGIALAFGTLGLDRLFTRRVPDIDWIG